MLSPILTAGRRPRSSERGRLARISLCFDTHTGGVVLRLFTTRHAYALPPQVVAGPPHRQVVKRHTAGLWAHLSRVTYTDFREFLFHDVGWIRARRRAEAATPRPSSMANCSYGARYPRRSPHDWGRRQSAPRRRVQVVCTLLLLSLEAGQQRYRYQQRDQDGRVAERNHE